MSNLFFHLELEYCEKSLRDYKYPISVEKALRYVLDICNGLEYAHNKGIIHGDLKPGNILIKNDVPKISDWGIGWILPEEKEKASEYTSLLLTPAYVAPEQLQLRKGAIDERTDLYQLGLIFYKMVTGKLPSHNNNITDDFSLDLATIVYSPSVASVLKEKKRIKITPPSKINPRARILDPIIMKLLEYSKENRYQSVTELKKDLEKLIVY